MKQQTAVEWLVQQITDINYTTIDTSNSMDCKIPLHIFNKLVEQAKQVEKEQIIDSFVEGVSVPYMDAIGERRIFVKPADEYLNAEQYYNETYNK